MRKSTSALVAIASIIVSICLSESGSALQRGPTSPLDDSLVEFTCNIFRNARLKDENFVLSPISIHQALNLLLVGAKKHSQTSLEIERALGYDPKVGQRRYFDEYTNLKKNIRALSLKVNPYTGKKSTVIDIWSSIITKNGVDFRPSYIDATSHYFNSSVGRILDDVPSTKHELIEQTNKWAKEAGFDNDVLTEQELDGISSGLLLSAVRVEAPWLASFSESMEDYTFYNHNRQDEHSRKSRAILGSDYGKYFGYLNFTTQNQQSYGDRHDSVMHKNAKLVKELASLNFQVLNIDLEDGLSFTIFEPLNTGTAGNELDKLVNRLTTTDLADNEIQLTKVLELIENPKVALPMEIVKFPKFKFDSAVDLMASFKAMGMNKTFSKSSELTDLTFQQVLVDKVSHRAFIETNQYGIKGAAITKVEWTTHSAAIYDKIFRVEVRHPFMFMVRFGKLPLFIGQVVEV